MADEHEQPEQAPAPAQEPQPRAGMRGWFQHAFAVEAYDESSLADEEKAVLQRLAQRIDQRRLTSAAIFWMQSNRNLNWVGSQVMVMFQPLFELTHPVLNMLLRNFGLNVPPADYPLLCTAFEKRYSIEYFIQCLEAAAAGQYNIQPAPASDEQA